MQTPRDEDWDSLDAELRRILALAPPARVRALADLDATDPALAGRLRRMLSFASADDPILDVDTATASPAPESLGTWRMIRQIGQGGMAEVFEAERTVAGGVQRAAIKLLAWGQAGPWVRESFRRESAILARLEDPRIARLIDSGEAPDGRPWLAMEYVEGDPVDAACDACRVGIRERVRLVIEAGRAVAYAHRNLVVHRDLKPDNILLDADGRIRVLDFGIARVSESADRDPDVSRVRAFTPGCASPEQLAGEPVGVPSDVYQLGLLLYRLLTGTSPLADAPMETVPRLEAMRSSLRAPSRACQAMGTERAAARGSGPARLARRCRGDLDAIMTRALAFEPDRRYGTAEGLADDLQRWLDGMPVTARPFHVRYRARKFLQRHWVGASALATIAVLMIGYLLLLGQHNRQLQVERDAARAAQVRAESMHDFMLDVFGTVDPELSPSRGKSMDELLADGMARIRADFASEPTFAAQLIDDIGTLLLRRGRVDDAVIAYREVLQLRTEALGAGNEETMATLPLLAEALLHAGELVEALEFTERHLAEVVRLHGQYSVPYVQALLAASPVISANGDDERALSLADEAVSLHEALRVTRPEVVADEPLLRTELRHQRAVQLLRLRDYAAAAPLLQECVARFEAEFGRLDSRSIEARTNLAFALRFLKRREEARSVLLQLLEHQRELYQGPHWRTAYTLGHLANLASDGKDYERAIELWEASEQEVRDAVGDTHPWILSAQVAGARSKLLAGRCEEGETTLRRIAALDDLEGQAAARAAQALERYGCAAGSSD